MNVPNVLRSIVTGPACVAAYSALPAAKLASTVGTGSSPPRSTYCAFERAGVLPSLKMITPTAPASTASSIFVTNGQVPRWISATAPATAAG